MPHSLTDGAANAAPFILLIRKSTNMPEFTIYTQAGFNCPYCDKAKELLDTKELDYAVKSLDRESLITVAGIANMTTVPIIYHGNTLIGGFDDLEAHLSE